MGITEWRLNQALIFLVYFPIPMASPISLNLCAAGSASERFWRRSRPGSRGPTFRDQVFGHGFEQAVHSHLSFPVNRPRSGDYRRLHYEWNTWVSIKHYALFVRRQF